MPIPAELNNYRFIDTFNRAGDVEGTVVTYSDLSTAATWADSDTAGNPYITNAAGYAIEDTTPATAATAVCGVQTFAGAKKVRIQLTLADTGGCNIFIRKTSNSVHHNAATFSGFQIAFTESGTFDLHLQVLSVAAGSGTAIADTAGSSAAAELDASILISTETPILIEDTGTQIKVSTDGTTRTWTLSDASTYATNDYIGFNLGAATDKLHEVRVW